MKAKSIKGKSPEEIKKRLSTSMSDGYKPILAFVFLSGAQFIEEISNIMSDNGIQIFGATAIGEFNENGVEKDSIVILLFDIESSHFLIKFEDIIPENSEQTAKIFATEGLAKFSNPAFIISVSNVKLPSESILKGFKKVVGDNVTVIGGVASDEDMLNGSRIFTNERISKQGLMCLVLNQDKISVNGFAVSGWKPIGTIKTVTKSEGNRIFTIDDQPALDLIIKYTGIEVDLNNKKDLYNQLGSSMPLQIQKDEGSPVMNPPLMFNPSDHSVICGSVVPEGSKIRFSLPPDFDIIEDVIENAKNAKLESIPKADALLVFSCIGRLEALGPLINSEIEGLQEVWGVPMAGFFSFGEFGKTPGGKSEFHGTTCSWLTLTEKDNK